MPKGTRGQLSPGAKALLKARSALLVCGLCALGVFSLIGWTQDLEWAAIVIAAGTSLAILADQWWILWGLSRKGASPVVWLALSYTTKIAIVALGLYLPHAMGIVTRFPALVVAAVLLTAMLAELVVISRARIPTVDARGE